MDGLLSRVADLLEGKDHLGGVVDVGIVVVLELKGPAARNQIGPLDRPVPAGVDLLGLQPLRRPRDRRVADVIAGIGERDQ
jgi:hypothetical protein